MGDIQEKIKNELQYQTKKALKRNLQDVLTETLKLLANRREKNNAAPIFK